MGGLGSDQPGQLTTSLLVRGCGELWVSLLPTRWPLTSCHPWPLPSVPQAPQTVELPAVAGHTLTARRGLSLLLVGGYSPENGFNQQLLEYQLTTGTWVSGAQSGTPPTGGHSAFGRPAVQGFV